MFIFRRFRLEIGPLSSGSLLTAFGGLKSEEIVSIILESRWSSTFTGYRIFRIEVESNLHPLIFDAF